MRQQAELIPRAPGDGKPDFCWSEPCNFIAQLSSGRVTAVEADRKAMLSIAGNRIAVERYVPQQIR